MTADLQACLNDLSSSQNAASVLLRSRALIRIGDAARAVTELRDFDVVGTAAPLERAESHTIMSAAQIVLDQIEDAEYSLTNARALTFASGHIALEAEIYFISALLSWKDGRARQSRKFLHSILSLNESPSYTFVRAPLTAYPFSLPYWRARAHELQGKHDGNEKNSVAQAESLTNAFVEFDRVDTRDLFIEASVLLNAAFYVRESGHQGLKELVTERAAQFPWTPSTGFFEFNVFLSLGTRCAYEGDHLSALRNHRRAAEIAPSTPLRLLALLERCRLIFDLGESMSATEELDYAIRLSSQVDWSTTNVQERQALLYLATVLAPIDVKQARASFTRYHASSSSRWTVTVPFEIKQARASSCFAESRILFAEGEPKRAITLLLEAHRIFREIGSGRQTARTALEIYEHTGEPYYADIVSREALRYRDSILARRMRTLAGTS